MKYASFDALTFAETLKDQPKYIFSSIYTKVLTDNEVTRNNVLDSINSFLSRATSNDVIIIFAAGHGVFTYAILDGLKGNADYNKDCTIDVAELFRFVELHVAKITNGHQNPHFTKGGGHLPIYSIVK